MSTRTYHRWPKLCEYSGSNEIESHWPGVMGKTWCLPPILNVRLNFAPTSIIIPGEYRGSTRLMRNYGNTWAYEPLIWPGNEGIRMVSKFSMDSDYDGAFWFFWAELHYMVQDIFRVGWSREWFHLWFPEQPDYSLTMPLPIYTTHTYPTDGEAILYPASLDKAWEKSFTPLES